MTKQDAPAELNLDLFGERAEQAPEEIEDGKARVQTPDRRQVELRAVDLESLLEPDHRARFVWGYVERQDLSALYDKIKARGSAPGRRAIDPKILFALWLYATLEGVGSGREINRLCQEHDAYRWICGGVTVNYHAVNDFRSNNEKLLDELLSKNVAVLASIGVITLKQVAQDGVRVRASAGASSLKRRERLGKHLRLAQQLVAQLKERAAEDPGEASRKALAARERAAREMQRRIELALAQMPEAEETLARNRRDPKDARVSTTDAQARRMKMADGGFRPAYNVQYAVDCDSQVVVGVDVVNTGADQQQMAPMVEQVEKRVGRAPEHWLVDGGFVSHEQINAVANKTTVLAPVPEAKPRKTNKDDDNRTPPPLGSEFEPRKGDSQAVKAWRQRMSQEDAKALYRKRAATIECVNAQARNRGLQQFRVRGQLKARAVALLHALAHNVMRMMTLAPTELGAAMA